MKKLKIEWADKKEDFIGMITDGDYHITKDLKLIYETEGDGEDYDSSDFVDSVCIGDTYHTTSRLIQFCSEFHPEVNFDAEFETDEPGVFARYQERFGFDYSEWIVEQIYKELKEALEEMGYSLPFD